MHVGKSRESPLDRMHPNCTKPLTFALFIPLRYKFAMLANSHFDLAFHSEHLKDRV
jgi:hypothetical protein